jgi:general secretion pathway protein K
MSRHAGPEAGARQRGAALLLAMILVALVATLAGAMVWQQARAVQVEAAERSRSQSAWILHGALDWSRLILREDARSGGVDHLGEPWATPLAEARLSTFLAADRDNNTDSGPEAFLSGIITDAQARYNLRNVVADDGKVVPAELAALGRLCEAAGLPTSAAARIAGVLATAWKPAAPEGSGDNPAQPIAPRRIEQLVWLGIEPEIVKALRHTVDLLPARTPVNVNTAPREVLAAVLDIDPATAERLVQLRQRSAFGSLDKLKPHLGEDFTPDAARVAVGSAFFEVRGRLRLEERVLEERSLVQRRGSGSGAEVVAVFRERTSLAASGTN